MKNPVNLPANCEIIGILKEINNINDGIELIFTFEQKIKISHDESLLNKLNNYLGKMIGLINIDGEYKIRILQKNAGKNIESQNEVKNSKKDINTFQKEYNRVVKEIDVFLKGGR